MHQVDTSFVTTESLTKSFGWENNQVYEQHDVNELNRILFDAIERSLQDTDASNLITDLYRGTLVNKIICHSCQNVSARDEYFQDVNVLVNGFDTIADSLGAFVNFEILNENNQYFCEKCQTKRDASKGILFKSLPKVLIFSLGRFEFDYREDKRKKISSVFRFPLVLDMNPYSEQRDPSFVPKNENLKKNRAKRIEQPEIDLNSPHLYELFAVVIHSGGAYGGHYHTYIRDLSTTDFISEVEDKSNSDEKSEKEEEEIDSEELWKKELESKGFKVGNWFDFDDSTIKKIPVEKIATQFGGGGESAYMLIYRKKGLNASVGSSLLPHLSKYLEEENKIISDEREKFEKAQNSINVQILNAEKCKLTDNLELEAPKTDEVEFSLDKRWRMNEIVDKLRETHPQIGDGLNFACVLERVESQNEGEESNGKYIATRKIDLKSENLVPQEEISENTIILLWNGLDVCGKSFDGLGSILSFKLRKNQEDTLDIQARSSELISDFLERISSLLSIPLESLILLCNGKSLTNLNQKATILSAKVVDSSFLLAKDKREFAEKEEGEELKDYSGGLKRDYEAAYVLTIHNLIPHSPSQSFETDADPYGTIFDLKKKVFSQISTNFDLHETRLGRKVGNNTQFFNEESASLLDVGIEDKSEVSIYYGEPESLNIRLRFVMVKDGRPVSNEQKEVDADPRESIEDLKVKMAAVYMKESEKMRLRRTDALEAPTDVITDEEATVESLGLNNWDLLYLEEGRPPLKGEIRVWFVKFTSNCDNVKELEVPYVSAALFNLWSIQRLSCEESGTNKQMFHVDITSFYTIEDLKNLLVTQSELKDLSPNSLRLWSVDRLLSKNSFQLKKWNVADNSTITVEIVDPEANAVALASENSTLIYLQSRNSSTKKFGSYREILVDTSLSFVALRKLISSSVGVSEENLNLFRLNRANGSWQDLDEMENMIASKQVEKPSTEKKGKSEKSKSGPTIKGKPWSFKDGDVIVWKNKLEDPNNEDNFAKSIVVKTVTLDKKDRSVYLESGEIFKRRKPKEAVLSIEI
eukprot:TRINITY_DN5452_c0_g1_i3.p1 TRINITY_DN5452_c0_g1~~TRINITY_DN5452_c0_g1_i3.p1  ORF type:complete len:1042 (-),score=382.12 TRINITY_DN5452_c0_g1_i3:49-3174(-)